MPRNQRDNGEPCGAPAEGDQQGTEGRRDDRCGHPLPEYTGGEYVGILVGLQDVSLNPMLIGMLWTRISGVQALPTLAPTLFRASHLKEFGVSLMIEGAERLSRPEKSGRRKRRSRRRPCLCLLSRPGWGGENRGSHRHRHQHQHQHQQQN